MGSPFPAARAMPLSDGYGGKITAYDELPIHALGDEYDIEGNGTVNRIQPLPSGIVISARIMGTPTFKNSARLLCPNGIDYTATPGDAIIARSYGDGVWRLNVLPASGESLADRSLSLTATQRGNVASNLQCLTTPQGRLTITSLTPVMTASSSTSSIFYTPYVGNVIPLFDGTNMVPTVFAELLQQTTDTTKSPAASANSSVYDMFVWNDSGTVRLSRGPLWTNDTTRSAGTALVMVNGILLNSVSITNGPAASRGTYVGTIRTNSVAVGSHVFGAAASGGTAAFFGVWNMYNRVAVGTVVTDSGTSYTYASSTIRQSRASAGNQIQFVSGLAEDSSSYTYSQRIDTAASSSNNALFGIGLDSTSAFTGLPVLVITNSAASFIAINTAAATIPPQIGVHTVSANEQSPSGTNTFNNSAPGGSFYGLLRI
jgi:hypothetical protein